MNAKKEDDELSRATDALTAAFNDAPNPPPHFEEALDTLSDTSTGVGEDELRARREALLSRLALGRSVGELLRGRREALDIDIAELSRRSSWRPERVEDLEANRLDLATVDAERLGMLLVTLGLRGLGMLEEPLRLMARTHLAVYKSASGPVFGRTRKGVSSFDRRRDLQRDVAAIDEEATTRQVDRYLGQVREALEDLPS